MSKRILPLCALGLIFAASCGPQAVPQKDVKLLWHAWSDEVFSQAKRDNRFVLLDLEAVWCHWCHVMDAVTYSNPAVIKLLQSHYIIVKADQDSRPDLSNRYEDYGWPATVVFNADGGEIVKRRGYLPPAEMISMLQAIIDDPSAGPSVRPAPRLQAPASPALDAATRRRLDENYLRGYDTKQGSWGFNQKLLDWDSVEYAMVLASRDNNVRAERMAKHTLAMQLHLLDPAWGGVYQYSAGGDWNSPHFEKIMQMQAENLRIYSLAYALWRTPAYLHAAQEIRQYLKIFLTSPEGGFYTSQDADLIEGRHSVGYFALSNAERRRRGIPRVDKHMYARENGWAITGLVSLYAATREQAVLDDAVRAARWVLDNRALPAGGFHHDARDAAGPYLGDSVAMARAFLALYGATGDRNWLQHAEAVVKFIDNNFREDEGVGFVTSKTATDKAYQPRPQRDENAAVVRTAILLFHYTGEGSFQQMAQRAMRYLAADPVVDRLPASTVLLADFELSTPPLHLTVVGPKDDPIAHRLFLEALAYPSSYKRLEWLDRSEGPLPNLDVQYPELNGAAAFVCSNSTCSSPIFKTEDLRARVDKLLSQQLRARRPYEF